MAIGTLVLVILISLLSLMFVIIQYQKIKRASPGTAKMQEISEAIHEGAMAFLFREYKILSVFVATVFLVLSIFISWITAISFLIGAVLSTLAGFMTSCGK